MTETLAQRLRIHAYLQNDRLAGDAAAALEAQAAQIANFKTVMIAAAEEISEHWDAHCDAEGYGPSNLMHRLEQGIPSQYGYTAGAFAKLKAERDAQAAQIEALRDALAVAVRQNEHDMLMTGEELRACRAALLTGLPTMGAAMAAKEPR